MEPLRNTNPVFGGRELASRMSEESPPDGGGRSVRDGAGGRSAKESVKSDELDPAELVRRCKEGEQEAWEDLVKRYQGVVYRAIVASMKYMHVYPRFQEAVEDIFQETFREVYSSFKSFQGLCSISTWLTVVARRTTYREINKLKNQYDRISDVPDAQNLAMAGVRPKDRELEIKDLATKLEGRLMKRLSKKGQLFYRLIFRTDLTVKEICAMEGVSPEAVRTWKKRIREKMQQLFKEEMGSDRC